MNLTTASDLEGRWNRNGIMKLKDEVGLSIREREEKRKSSRSDPDSSSLRTLLELIPAVSGDLSEDATSSES